MTGILFAVSVAASTAEELDLAQTDLDPIARRLSSGENQVLDSETLLLEFALGETRSFLWVVSSHEVSVHELPPARDIENLARRVHGYLSAPAPQPFEPADVYEQRIATAERQWPRAAAQLSRVLLTPARAHLDKGQRLVVVADGALTYVPFGALPNPADNGRPLLGNHEVVLAPSATSIATLRRRPPTRRPSKTLAVVADPIFGRETRQSWFERVLGPWLLGQRFFSHLFGRPSGIRTVDDESPPALRRALRDVDSPELVPLPGTRIEAEAILAMVPESERFAALGYAANRDTVVAGALAGHRIVHFATHALLNSEYPELSGLVLSLVDENGRPRDGFLRLHDVYDLELDAELVVLSACRTALGREVRGEELVGLTGGFLAAGASAVVASLWSPDDEATAELMQRFYRAMLTDGLTPAAALRQARLDMARDSNWKDPYFWAPFVFVGDWHTTH